MMAGNTDNTGSDLTQPPSDEIWQDSPPSWFDSENYDPLPSIYHTEWTPDSASECLMPTVESELYPHREDMIMSKGCPLNEVYTSNLASQLQETHKWINYLGEENRILYSKLQSRDSENEVLKKRLNNLEQEAIPSLERALTNAAMEKDASIVTLLLKMKKHLNEVEEERCRIWLEQRITEKVCSRGGAVGGGAGSSGNI